MGLLDNVLMGFSVALQPANLMFCFIGCVIGTLVGVLPGFGPSAAIALLFPITFYLNPSSAMVMLAGIYYGAQYGGSTSAILVNIPGEAGAVMTCLDGYQMARKGRAGPALGISAIASFIAATLSVAALMVVAPPLSEMALKFGPPEFFALMILCLTIVSYLSTGSFFKGLLMASIGLFLGTVGTDTITGTIRFDFGSLTLLDGIGLIPLLMGIFGIGEVLSNLDSPEERGIYKTKIGRVFPNRADWMESKGAILRGAMIGFFVGLLPGGGTTMSTFASYAVEKRLSKTPEKFGTGMIAGVAGPEAANNASAQASFIPLLTLGIPGNGVMAILMGALIIHGVTPGPMLIRDHSQLFWAVATSMYIGNLMLLGLNMPLIGMWVKILKVPYGILFPLILLFCLTGCYSIKNNVWDIFLMTVFGVAGYLMRKFKFDAPPLILAFILGPIMEQSLRSSLLMAGGNPVIFLQRPISLVIILCVGVIVISTLIPLLIRKKPG